MIAIFWPAIEATYRCRLGYVRGGLSCGESTRAVPPPDAADAGTVAAFAPGIASSAFMIVAVAGMSRTPSDAPAAVRDCSLNGIPKKSTAVRFATALPVVVSSTLS